MTSVHLLHAGYAGDRVGSSVVLVRDGDAVIVVDPGMVARRGLILEPLAAHGVAPEAVTHGRGASWIRLRRRTSTGSSPRSAAMRSRTRSVLRCAWGWPKPR